MTDWQIVLLIFAGLIFLAHALSWIGERIWPRDKSFDRVGHP